MFVRASLCQEILYLYSWILSTKTFCRSAVRPPCCSYLGSMFLLPRARCEDEDGRLMMTTSSYRCSRCEHRILSIKTTIQFIVMLTTWCSFQKMLVHFYSLMVCCLSPCQIYILFLYNCCNTTPYNFSLCHEEGDDHVGSFPILPPQQVTKTVLSIHSHSRRYASSLVQKCQIYCCPWESPHHSAEGEGQSTSWSVVVHSS